MLPFLLVHNETREIFKIQIMIVIMEKDLAHKLLWQGFGDPFGNHEKI